MSSLPPPSLRLRVDQSAIAHNWREMDRLSGAAQTAAAVKADAYGIGVGRALPALRSAGCEHFYVAHWGEVSAVLDHAPASAIAVLHGPLTHRDCKYALATGVRPVINSIRQAQLWHEAGGGPCDLMVDTGMNRLGLRREELGDPAIAALDVDVLMSHLACADEESALNGQQARAFRAIVGEIPHHRASLANSAGVALGKAFAFGRTRPGLALYGGVPREELAGHIRQVVTPEAALLQVRHVPAGESVGYGATFAAPHDMRVGIVSIGYADGYLRCWSEKGTFRHGDALLPVLGRVSMDMTAVDLTKAPALREGDWIEADYALPEAARISGLSQYELLTLSGPRIRG